MDHNIPEKANRVLNVILFGLLLILIRVWYLATIQHDEHLERSRKPQRRTIVEKVDRATIRDRFNLPLALNKLQYNAAICYADIRHIPHFRWEKNEQGKPIRVQARVKYIQQLAEALGKELRMDPQKIEDLIHGKASLFPHTPFVIKEDLTEREYYTLKMLEKDWLGICAEKSSKRYYPKGKMGCDVIGYMGAISSKEYRSIAEELSVLQTYLSEREAGNTPMLPKGFSNPFQARERLKQLQEKAYTINDSVGKMGVEAVFDPELRGYAGRKTYEIDIKGNSLRELPGTKKAITGQRLLLSISSQLQEYAEQLLAEHEKLREIKDSEANATLSTPWIRGGAIVAMDPSTGEVLALASYPRIDPNDFIPSKIHEEQNKRQSNINKWLENETYIAEIWDGKRLLERERWDSANKCFYEETIALTWERYCESVLAPKCAANEALHKIATLSDAILLQTQAEKLLHVSGQTDMRTLFSAIYSELPHRAFRTAVSLQDKNFIQQHLVEDPSAQIAKQILDRYLAAVLPNEDKLLVLDLCRMLINTESFTPELCTIVGATSLSNYRSLTQYVMRVQHLLHSAIKSVFHETDFKQWRQEHFKDYLRAKRKEEREKKRYSKPYTEYLEQKESEMFKAFWESSRWALMHLYIRGEFQSIESRFIPYIERMNYLYENSQEIKYCVDVLRNALRALSSEDELHFLQTMRCFNEMKRPLYGHYSALRNTKGMQLEKHLAAAFYPLTGFGYGRSQAFRQATPQGSVFKIVVAYHALMERYLSLKEKHQQLTQMSPLTLIDDPQWHSNPTSNERVLGYTLEGKPITRLYKGGILPRSHARGKIDIVGAIEQSSNIYFSILAAEQVQDPLSLIHTTRQFGFGEKSGIELLGEFSGILPDDISYNRTGLYAFAIGQHSLIVTPLQTAVMLSAIANKGHILKPTIVQLIAGKEPLGEYRDPFSCGIYPFQEALSSIGIDFPLFTSTQPESDRAQVWYSAPEIRRSLPFPEEISDPLIQGMRRSINGTRGTARPEIIRSLYLNPRWRQDYLELRQNIICKTGTAEILYKHTLDAETNAKINNHIWCGAVYFDTPEHAHPELAVSVYLRFSEAGGKEAAPLAIEVMKKWREINTNPRK